ncbi:MAG: DUF192 domain-containing protein [Actinobacteria bacterium]|nr:DUF192 domain-containing protein [Actinomycetota bacterium]
MAPAPYSAVATVIERSGEVVAPIVGWAETPATRSRGLLGRSELVSFGAFVLCGAKQVHTFGMDRPIDVALCDKAWNVLHVARAMPPNRLGKVVLRAHYAIEARPGTLDALRRGDRLRLKDL